MTAAVRVGWCPGALRPMRSGDGLLVRVKPRAGVLTLDQAGGIAALAETYGNGHIDLTGRANLQIRGVSDATLDALTAGLDRLVLLDGDPATEAVRNIVASPLHGLDPQAAVDVGPVVAALEARLADDPVCRQLPPKWGIVVDDGGSVSLDDVAADLRIRFAGPGSAWLGLSLDAWAPLQAASIPDALSGVARIAARHGGARMSHLRATIGADPLFAAIGLQQALPPPSRPAFPTGALLGPARDGACVGVAPPFGSLQARDLQSVVEAGRQAGARDVRLTPWRLLLVTLGDRSDDDAPPRGQGRDGGSSRQARAVALARACEGRGLIVDGADPRLQIVACTGAPGCHRGTVSTRAGASALASLVGEGTGIRFHVSGCAKGCARPAPTAWTLVGRDGRYDLVRQGKAQDAPVAQGLSFNAAVAWVRGAMQAMTL